MHIFKLNILKCILMLSNMKQNNCLESLHIKDTYTEKKITNLFKYPFFYYVDFFQL